MELWGARQKGKAALVGEGWCGLDSERDGGKGTDLRAPHKVSVSGLLDDWPLGARRVGDKKGEKQ